MFSKFLTVMGGLIIALIIGFVCYPMLIPKEQPAPVVKTIKAPKKEVIKEVKSEEPESVVVHEDGSTSLLDEEDTMTDEESASILDTWGTEPIEELSLADQNADASASFDPGDGNVVTVDSIVEEDSYPLDPKQQRVPALSDAKRRNTMIREAKRITELFDKEVKKESLVPSEEFSEQDWRNPAEIKKKVTDRMLKRLGNLSDEKIWDFIKNPDCRRDLALLQLIRLTGVETLESIAKKHTGRILLSRLGSDFVWMSHLLYSGPIKNMQGTIANLAYIFTKYAELIDDSIARKIGACAAIEFANKGMNTQLMFQRFTYYYMSMTEGLLNKRFEELQAWDMRWVLGMGAPNSWGGVKNYTWLRDNVRLHDDGYVSSNSSQMYYKPRNVAGDKIAGSEYMRCFMKQFGGIIALCHREVGGVCGAFAHYATYAAAAAGIPSSCVNEPGHQSYAVRVGNEWKIGGTIYWQRGLEVNLWNEPAWDFLVLTQRLYGDNYQTTLLSDQMVCLGDNLAALRKMHAAMICYENAIVIQPLNWPAMLRYNKYLADKAPEDINKWMEFHDRVNEGLNDKHHNAASRMFSRYIYPNLLPLIPDYRKKAKLFAEFFKKCTTMGYHRWDVSPVLTEQLSHFKGLEEQTDYMAEALGALIPNPDYSGEAITWGVNYIESLPDNPEKEKMREAFTEVIITALTRARKTNKNEDATWNALGEAILAAGKNKNRFLFTTVGKVAKHKLPKRFPRNRMRFRGVPGSLVSTTAMLTADMVIKPGGEGAVCLHYGALQKDGGEIYFEAKMEVELEKNCEINGIAIVTGDPLDPERTFCLEISEDGQNWKEVSKITPEGVVMRADLRKQELKGKYLRVYREGAGTSRDMLGYLVRGFYVYGKIIK